MACIATAINRGGGGEGAAAAVAPTAKLALEVGEHANRMRNVGDNASGVFKGAGERLLHAKPFCSDKMTGSVLPEPFAPPH
jgi:hypothetical protein